MAGIQNQEILRLFKDAFRAHNITQLELANKLGIKSPYLSRQLSGKDPMSIDRAYQLLKLIPIKSPYSDNLRDLLVKDTHIAATDKAPMILECKQKIEQIGNDSYLSFILDIWRDLNVTDRQQIFRIFLDYVEKKNQNPPPKE